MKKIIIAEELTGKELYHFLIEHKAELIAQKKSLIKNTEPMSYDPVLFQVKGAEVVKAASSEIAADATSVRVKVVANAAMWCDSAMDVLLPDCWKKTIKERKGMIPHLHDHIHTIEAEVGDVASIYSEDISLRELGLRVDGSTQCLIFETDIKKAYNEKVFNKYAAGKVKQHSIGLQYGKIELAINDKESEKEFDFWNKYIDKVINREFVESRGFFWVVPEIKLLENSAVLFGANQLTPTLDVKVDTQDQPPLRTGTEPLHQPKAFNLSEAIKETKFFN
jgi:hypothetical protein